MSQFYRHNDTLYLVIRRIPHFMFHKRDGEYLQDLFLEWKEKLKADHVLKDQTHYMFCHTIEDAVYEEIVEEINVIDAAIVEEISADEIVIDEIVIEEAPATEPEIDANTPNTDI
jgi:peptidyl-tRNA hydrolase